MEALVVVKMAAAVAAAAITVRLLMMELSFRQNEDDGNDDCNGVSGRCEFDETDKDSVGVVTLRIC